MFNLEYWIPKVRDANEKWWHSITTGLPIERNEGELHMLMSSELAEAMEGERKNLDDDKLPQFKMACVEMADFSIRIVDYASHRTIKLTDMYPDIRYHLVQERNSAVHPSYEQSAELWLHAMDAEDKETLNRAGLIWDLNLRLSNVYTAAAGSYDKDEGFSMLIALARLYCNIFGYPFDDAFEAKYEFNLVRQDHKHESRMREDGKKF